MTALAPKRPNGPCSVDDCGKPTRSAKASLCETHYYRQRRTGTTELIVRPTKWPKDAQGRPVRRKHPVLTPLQYLEQRIEYDTNGGCWLWSLAEAHFGYGVCWSDGKFDRAHRLAWRLYKGEIPEGQFVCHKCDVPRCCNPDHLFLGSQKDNVRDAMRKGRRPTFTGNKTPRLARRMTPGRKRRLWEAHDYKCAECLTPVPALGPDVVYDHRIPLWVSGDDSDDNIRPLCRPCDTRKTALDMGDIAKVRRLIRKADPLTRKPSTLKSRGFDKTRSRGFDGKVRRKTLRAEYEAQP